MRLTLHVLSAPLCFPPCSIPAPLLLQRSSWISEYKPYLNYTTIIKAPTRGAIVFCRWFGHYFIYDCPLIFLFLLLFPIEAIYVKIPKNDDIAIISRNSSRASPKVAMQDIVRKIIPSIKMPAPRHIRRSFFLAFSESISSLLLGPNQHL